jgi:hypothetical protein
VYEFQTVSPDLQNRARILDSGEACWSAADVAAVMEEITAANRVILAFDMCTFPGGRAMPRLHGGSTFEMDEYASLTWAQRVTLSLKLATADLARATELSGLQPPHDDIWFVVTSAGENDAEAGA